MAKECRALMFEPLMGWGFAPRVIWEQGITFYGSRGVTLIVISGTGWGKQ
jgi:hypothetical protein